MDNMLLFDTDTVTNSIQEYNTRHDKFKNQTSVITGIPTGISKLDEVTLGIQPRDLWIIQGRSGLGKTWTVTYLASNFRLNKYKVLFINREMDPTELEGRIASLSAKFSYNRWRKGKLTASEYARYVEYKNRILSVNGWIGILPPQHELTINDISNIMDAHTPDIVIIDYLNLLTVKNKPDLFTAMREIANDIKGLAYYSKVPIVAVAQTNRSAVLNKNLVPGTEHIFGSDSIGWNADLVMSLYKNDSMAANKLLGLKISKYRHGEEIDMIMKWDLESGNIELKTLNSVVDVLSDTDIEKEMVEAVKINGD